MLAADYEDLQESEATDVYVKRFKARNIYVKELHGFPCVSKTLKSPAVDVDLVQEGEEGDKKGTFQGSFVVHERKIS